jgi:sugar phosphate isomerase/epimerase
MMNPYANRRSFLKTCSGVIGAAAFSAGAGSLLGQAAESTCPLHFSASSLPFSSLSLKDVCQKIAGLGFEAVDLWNTNQVFHCPHLIEIAKIGPDAARRIFEDSRLKLASFTLYMFDYPEYAKYAKLLHECGGGGCVGIRESKYDVKDTSYDELKREMKALFERLKPEIELADRYGDVMAIENHSDALLNSLDSFKLFVELNPSKQVGVALAPYHLQRANVPIDQVIDLLRDRIKFVYAWQFGEGMQQLPGVGPFDFTPMLAQLKKIGYTGYVNPFMHGEVAMDVMAEALSKSRQYLLSCCK